ncbi:hypothetical protein M1M86_01110 [Dehalococcoidales bacterium]|nr:hypothetical protein [Dehalococcoidales bacterium]
MDKESIDQPKPRWFIDLDWYQQNNRSFLALAQGCLCPKCNERLKVETVSTADLLATIKDCCSKMPGFISGKLPILESIFRLFLASGNQPLDLEELGRQLSRWRDGDTYCASAEVLSRLLRSEQYYGLRQVP